ncbi:MAG: TetR/AcrR family transcriptional regulator [Planctomycetes bacterium]|nr:TetR/AcrR family transcriptional regulator [Planctomycetota bacterium]MCP4770652.1 TetR/AcrR family transcriptional regulator [Planctomycetota bacterium]
MPGPDTKQRILDAAQTLFAERGFPATSLREITKLADVNLAAVNYHFGSKDGLLKELVNECIEPINKERIRLLDAAEAEAGGQPLVLRDLVRIFIEPAVREMCEENGSMPCVLSRLHHEPHAGLEEMMADILGPTISRFIAATHRCLPHRTPEELMIRGHFMVGAMLHLLDFNCEELMPVPGVNKEVISDYDFRLEQLVSFCTAGFDG